MTRSHRALTLALLLICAAGGEPRAAAATGPDTRPHVEHLAAEGLGGRMTGTSGERASAEYLEQQLRGLGFQPLPGQDGFVVPFSFTAGVKDTGTSLTLSSAAGGPRVWSDEETIRALSFSEAGQETGEVVFAGYGVSVPPSQPFSYDSYAGLDVKDKIVLVLRYLPEDADQETRAVLARYSGLRYKALAARERGAKGLLVVTGPRSPNAGETIPMTFDTAAAGSEILAASVSSDVAEALLASSGKSLAAAQQALDSGNPHVPGFTLPGVRVTLDVKVARQEQTGRNVVGYLPAPPSGTDKPFVMIGAHYDHLGRGVSGSSLARADEQGRVHPGADDNASGVAAVLEAAELLKTADRKRHVVVAFWSGEEIGLLGSAAFIKAPTLPADRIAAYVNLDMVGRMRDNRLVVQGTGSSTAWPALVEAANVPVGFDVQLQADPYLPTDVSSTVPAGIPSVSLFTGSHPDYHRPTDVAASVNYEDLDRVARFTALLAGRLANLESPPEYVKVERTTQAVPRGGIRVFTGTIPDYTTEVEGLRLSGVVGGGPAEKAGLREGDVIVEFAGQKIANIYDYTYALDTVKIGEPVIVVFLRDGQRLDVKLTPEARR